MKAKIVLILVISSLIIGCVDTPKSISSNNEISETVSSITDKLIGDCGSRNTLTTEQCDYWVKNNINNKYVSWSGIVSDVRDGVVYVNVDYKFPSGSNGRVNTYADASAIIALHDINIDKLINTNKNNNIQFTGKINIKKDYYMLPGYYNSWIAMTSNGGIMGHVDLYDSKIIKSDNTESSIKSNVQSGISSVKTGEFPKSKTFDVSYKKINNSYIQINVKNIGKESFSNVFFNIGSQRSPVLVNLNPGDYLSAIFNINEILGKDNNIDIWINYVWLDSPRNEVLRIAITT
ncbi:MAG: hypothetical protein OIN86_16360 [Candidatus Methanoperedens sp.]|nr:hypothetical protein [Candidatus Methanoperedens sp.]CAG1007057.1 hypothetical protein METP1_03407 [Methanosarcinales archaeon]